MHTEHRTPNRLKDNILLRLYFETLIVLCALLAARLIVGYLYGANIIIIVFDDCPSTCTMVILSVMNFTAQR